MKTLSLISFLLISILLFPFKQVVAQTAKQAVQITGTIQDSATRAPLAYITVALKKKDDQPVKVAVTKSDGRFTLTVPEPLVYNLVVSAVNYVPQIIELDLRDSTQAGRNLDVIYIVQKAKTLAQVEVTAQKPVIKQEADRITYDLQADPDSKSLSILEMMRKVPFLSLDANNNVLLKGNSSYRIFINGRPSGMLTNNPREILSSMPASTVKSIEVITIPPAKYEGEGLAGIINIILIKKTSNGITGTLNVSEKFPQDGPGIGGSLAAKAGKFGISAYTGGRFTKTPATDISSTRNTFDTKATGLVQNGSTQSKGKTGYLGAELSFEVDSFQLLYGNINTYANDNKVNNNRYSLLQVNNVPEEEYRYYNQSKSNGKGLDASINYQKGFRSNRNKLLTFSYSYRNNRNDLTNNILIDDLLNYHAPDYNQYNTGEASEQAGQIDFVQPVKNMTIEAGISGIFRTNKSNYQNYLFDAANNNFKIDSTASNVFTNHQNVLAIYNAYNIRLKRWVVKAGARLEETITNADFVSTATKVRQNIYNLIPSLAVAYMVNDNNGLNFGFSRRIKRPGIYKLNPYVDRSNPNYESTGNPDLRPSIVNSILLGYGKSGKLNINVGLAFAFFDKLDLGVSEFDAARNVTVSTFKNTGKGTAYVGDFNVGYPITSHWNANLNSNLTYVRIKGPVNNGIITVNKLLYNLNLSNSYNFNKGWRTSVNVNAIGPNLATLQAISNGLVTSSFNLSKNLLKDKLSLSASVTNPFTKYRNNRVVTTGIDFSETNVTREYFRSFNFSMNLQLGKLKEEIKRNRRGLNTNDISNKSGL